MPVETRKRNKSERGTTFRPDVFPSSIGKFYSLPNIRHIFLIYSRTLLDFIPAFGVYYGGRDGGGDIGGDG